MTSRIYAGRAPRYSVGERTGRLVVLAIQSGSPRIYQCVCDCGTIKKITAQALRNKTKSCGCLRREKTALVRRTHGMSKTRTYTIWLGIIRRCNDSKERNFRHYGGRGIVVCDQWKVFENFLADMGQAPPTHSIERKDVNGNYEPSNCVWLPMRLQNRNTRRARVFELNGESKCIAEWAEVYGLRYGLVRDRLNLGWSIGRALGVEA